MMIGRIFKYASLLAAAVMLVSCQGQQGDDNNTDGPINGGGITGKIELTVDKVLIQADGTDYATLTVSLDGKAVEFKTEGDKTTFIIPAKLHEANDLEYVITF